MTNGRAIRRTKPPKPGRFSERFEMTIEYSQGEKPFSEMKWGKVGLLGWTGHPGLERRSAMGRAHGERELKKGPSMNAWPFSVIRGED